MSEPVYLGDQDILVAWRLLQAFSGTLEEGHSVSVGQASDGSVFANVDVGDGMPACARWYPTLTQTVQAVIVAHLRKQPPETQRGGVADPAICSHCGSLMRIGNDIYICPKGCGDATGTGTIGETMVTRKDVPHA